ncbi:Coiled-coil domain-containing protein 68, partial [Eschrichtius robustus]|nr:Coiled-coil domain-containing protein 68 [Eschrichtius robustus]
MKLGSLPPNLLALDFTMTAVTVTTTVALKGKIEDNSASYESMSAHIIEETEYVKKIRTTLEKIRNQIFKDEVRHNSTNHKQDAKVNTLEKEQKLKQHVENLNQIAEKLEEKHNQITELENLVQRMEK